MNVKPILFNTAMTRAILEGRKTQTRRIIKPQPTNPRWNNIGWIGWDDGHGYRMKPPCMAGDILWVRETWCDPEPDNYMVPIFYKADMPLHWDAEDTEHGEAVDITADEFKWRPSIHMPKDFARIFLRVKDVRVERLNDILAHAGEVAKEGIPYSDEGDIEASGLRFKELWDSTIKPADRDKYGWKANPWVWAIEFERCEEPEGWF